MACNCTKKRNSEEQAVVASRPMPPDAKSADEPPAVQERKILPTDSCIACAQKHMDEAYCLFTEYGYSSENRRLVKGNLRAIVLHTFKDWKEIADLARKCALLVQEAKDSEALDEMKRLGGMIDDAFYEANPEIKERLDRLVSGNS